MGASLRTQILNTSIPGFCEKNSFFLSAEQRLLFSIIKSSIKAKLATVADQERARLSGYLDWVYLVDLWKQASSSFVFHGSFLHSFDTPVNNSSSV